MIPAEYLKSKPSRHTERQGTGEPGAREPDLAEETPRRDADLVARTLAKDPTAFEELIHRYQKAIFNVAYYKSRNPFDAEDLAQDIFLAAYQALSSLKEPENFGGWLFGIAHNRCHKWYRRERTKILKFREIHQLKTGESQRELRPSRRLGGDEDEEKVLLSKEIQRLPHEIRHVLVLKYLEGKSYEVIGERLGLKPHRIDYLIRKGKALLKQRLERRRAP